jgi:hypothetical protein
MKAGEAATTVVGLPGRRVAKISKVLRWGWAVGCRGTRGRGRGGERTMATVLETTEFEGSAFLQLENLAEPTTDDGLKDKNT